MKQLFFIATIIISCNSCKTYKLSKTDKSWQPYLKGDILIFESNKGETDTIWIQKVKKKRYTKDPLVISPHYQGIFVSGEISLKYPIKTSSGHVFQKRFINIIDIEAGDTHSYITFNLNKILKDSLVYPTTVLTIDSLNVLEKKTLKFKYDAFEIIASDYYGRKRVDLKNYWWSKKYGYTAYEFNNGYRWELQQFIRNGENILKE